MADITNHKCPSCTGPLRYDTSGSLVCDYCGSVFSVQQIEGLYGTGENAEIIAETVDDAVEQANTQWLYGQQWGDDGEHINAYNCPSCGAELFCDETTAAAFCPYCGNNTVIPSQISDKLKPDYIIPFKVNKESALTSLKSYYSGKKLLPKEFEDKSHIDDIKGVYVPFWLYDGTVSADMQFSGTRINSVQTPNEIITTTEYYDIQRSGKIHFSKIPADASSKMPDDYMDTMEPYDYSELKPFSTAYLPGFLADIYDVPAQDASQRVLSRAVNTSYGILQNDVSGYSSCSVKNKKANMGSGYVHYALLPVWLLSTKWNDETYMFMLNGQTGKMAGDLPISKSKYFKWFLTISLPLILLFSFLFVFGGTFGNTAASFAVNPLAVLLSVLLPCLIATVICNSFKRQMTTTAEKMSAGEYLTDPGVEFTVRADRLVNRTVQRQPIQQYQSQQQVRPQGQTVHVQQQQLTHTQAVHPTQTGHSVRPSSNRPQGSRPQAAAPQRPQAVRPSSNRPSGSRPGTGRPNSSHR